MLVSRAFSFSGRTASHFARPTSQCSQVPVPRGPRSRAISAGADEPHRHAAGDCPTCSYEVASPHLSHVELCESSSSPSVDLFEERAEHRGPPIFKVAVSLESAL